MINEEDRLVLRLLSIMDSTPADFIRVILLGGDLSPHCYKHEVVKVNKEAPNLKVLMTF